MLEKSLRNLRVADLELFISAAHMKNLGKSASIHNISQSAASAAIQRVEAALGLRLCEHRKRQFELTRQGTMLLPKLEKWIRGLQNIVSEDDKTPIRFVTTHAMAQIAIPALYEIDNIEFSCKRPDKAYTSIINGEADIALVLDNAPWKGVISTQISTGSFQLYSSDLDKTISPIVLPEDSIEVLSLLQSWQQVHDSSLPVKSRIPSWSLIASICEKSTEVGFLPDFIAKKYKLHPVRWQPSPSQYRILAIYKKVNFLQQDRIDSIIKKLRSEFSLL